MKKSLIFWVFTILVIVSTLYIGWNLGAAIYYFKNNNNDNSKISIVERDIRFLKNDISDLKNQIEELETSLKIKTKEIEMLEESFDINSFIIEKNPDISKDEREAIVSAIKKYSKKYGFSEEFLSNWIYYESTFDRKARSNRNCKGLLQIGSVVIKQFEVSNPYSIDENIDAGCQYLIEQFESFKCWKKALAAYNAGPTAVFKKNGVPKYTKKYVKKLETLI